MSYDESHRRHLLTTFEYVDRLLGESFQRLTAQGDPLLFPVSVADATPEQIEAIAATLTAFRAGVRDFLQAHGIRPERTVPGALWSFRTALDYAWSALEEIAPARLTAYGPLDPADGEAAGRVMEELQALLRQLAMTLEASAKGPPNA